MGQIWQENRLNTKVSASEICDGWTAELQLFMLSDRNAKLDHLIDSVETLMIYVGLHKKKEVIHHMQIEFFCDGC